MVELENSVISEQSPSSFYLKIVIFTSKLKFEQILSVSKNSRDLGTNPYFLLGGGGGAVPFLFTDNLLL